MFTISTILQSLFLGVVQGLTEFIPVSSSGHLYLIPKLFGWESPSTIFILAAHLGTLIALLFYFRHQIWESLQPLRQGELKQGYKNNSSFRHFVLATLAAIPAGILGLVLEKLLNDQFYDAPETALVSALLTCAALIVVGLLFIVSHRLFTAKKHNLDKLTPGPALFIGLAQALAFIRGVSRSGITLLAGQSMHLNRAAAAEFSFLMSIPITAATSIYAIAKLVELPAGQLQAELVPAIIVVLSSMISGYVAIKFMLSFLKSNTLAVFGWYRIAFAVICLIILL